jgi:hypothetical protein
MRRTAIAAFVVFLFQVSPVTAQTAPSQEEIDKWKTEAPVLETSPCKMVTWLLEDKRIAEATRERYRESLAWWGRGFLEGAAYMIGAPGRRSEMKAWKKVVDFGLTTDVVAAHLSSYCHQHPTDRPIDAIQDLLLKALK